MIEALHSIFMIVLFSSAAASILAVFVILAKKIFKNRIGARTYCILWLLVFVKLIVTPFAPQSHFSIFSITKYITPDFSQKNTIHLVRSASSNHSMQPKTYEDSKIKNISHFDYTTVKNMKQSNPFYKKNIEAKNSHKNTLAPNIFLILSLIWLIGFLAVTFIISYASIQFIVKVNKSKRAVDKHTLLSINSYCPKFDISKNAKVFISPCVDLPCVSGILRPEVLIPEKLLASGDYRQISYMLMHEMAHLKRRDNAVNVITSMLNAIHWFNPIIWYVYRQLYIDREICCDTFALEQLEVEESVPYGMALINFAVIKGQRWAPNSVSSFCNSPSYLERRINMIKNFKKGSYKISMAALAMCMVISVTTLTNGGVSKAATNATAAAMSNSNNKFSLNNSDFKDFLSLERAKDFADFDFKVPDFLPNGYKLYNISLGKKNGNKQGDVIIDFAITGTPGGENNNIKSEFSLRISKDNLIPKEENSQNKYRTCRITKRSTKLGSMNGVCVESNYSYKPQKEDKYEAFSPISDKSKDFIWKDNGLWYCITYYDYNVFNDDNKKTSYTVNIPLNDLQRMVASFKLSQKVSHVKYVYTSGTMEIYNEKDLLAAKEFLGFTPKIIVNLPQQYTLYRADADSSSKTLSAAYRLGNSPVIPLNNLYLYEDKNIAAYNSMKNSKSYSWGNKSTEKVPVKLIRINNTDICTYNYIDSGLPIYTYVWTHNNICYTVSIPSKINNKDEIVRALLTNIK